MTMEFRYSVFGFIYTPWRLYIFVTSLINFVAFIMLLYPPESPKFMLAMGKPDEALVILARVYEANGYGKGKVRIYTNMEMFCINNNVLMLFKDFPVKEITLESIGSNLANVSGVKDVFKMIWKQTWPLFVSPFLGNMLMLCYLSFVLFAIAHGVYMW